MAGVEVGDFSELRHRRHGGRDPRPRPLHLRHCLWKLSRNRRPLPLSLPQNCFELSDRQPCVQRPAAGRHHPASVERQRMPRSLDLRTNDVQPLADLGRALLYRFHLESVHDSIRSLHGHPLSALVLREAVDEAGGCLRLPHLDDFWGYLCPSGPRVGRTVSELRLQQYDDRLPMRSIPDARIRSLLCQRLFLHPVRHYFLSVHSHLQSVEKENAKDAQSKNLPVGEDYRRLRLLVVRPPMLP